MMDGPSYQRAVTPSAESAGGGARVAPVRGKMLAYNRKQSSVGGGLGEAAPSGTSGSSSSARATGAPSGGARKTSTYVLAPPPSLDMNIQGRTASGISATPISRAPSSGKQQGEGQSQNYFLSNSKGNSDLEPLSDEIPADGVVFARSRSAPSHLVVFRTQEEKVRNPERLNLDRRQLDVCPLLKNEQRLRLLNYQNNNIRVISNLENLPNLIFLDMYNNKLNTLEGPLSTLRGLRVLMIGKNRISEIANLASLKKLDVLDLHSNDIGEITGLEGLADLRVLNLAGNRIKTVVNLSSLVSLTELNLRRNSIERIFDLDAIPSLQRIFLSHNLIKYMSDIKCIFTLKSLIELSLDGNPLSAGANHGKYRHAIITEMPGLKHLDLQKITDEERRPPVGAGSEEPPLGAAALPGTQGGGQQQQLFHLSKFLGAVGGIGMAGLPPSGSVPGSRVGTSHGARSKEVAAESAAGKSGAGSDSESQTSQPAVGLAARRNSKDGIGSGSGDGPEQGCVDQTNLGTIGLLKMSSSGLSASGQPAQNGGSAKSASPKPAPERVFAMNSLEVFDLPGAGNSKCLQATGEEWEWNQTRRTLSLVTNAHFDRIKFSVLAPKLVNNASLMCSLKKLILTANEVSSLNDIVALGNMFPTVEHLVFNKQPIEELSPALLQGAIITSFPKLKSYNQLPISDEEREKSLSIYGAILRADVGSSVHSAAAVPAAVMAFEASDADGFTGGGEGTNSRSAAPAVEDSAGIMIPSPRSTTLVNAAPAVSNGGGLAISNGKDACAPTTRPVSNVAGYNVASLGGNLSCVFSSTASASAARTQKAAQETALRARELDRLGFDEAFAAALTTIMAESIEDLRGHWVRYAP